MRDCVYVRLCLLCERDASALCFRGNWWSQPGWIFVDCDGRLRLAGYGLRDVTPCAHAAGRDTAEKTATGNDDVC